VRVAATATFKSVPDVCVGNLDIWFVPRRSAMLRRFDVNKSKPLIHASSCKTYQIGEIYVGVSENLAHTATVS
jgi:hypothetical protein